MTVNIDDETYEVVIIKKSIKNTYIRVKKDLKIYVSVNRFISEKYILNLILDNINSIKKMIEREKRKNLRDSKFYYLGREYQVILCKDFSKPTIVDDFIYVKKVEDLNKFLNKEAKRIFNERLKVRYDMMDADIFLPKLVIRKMKRKWGHCNKRDGVVTLNSELIKYDIDEIDYVIVHELCHLIHFDHSREFWKCVEMYKPDYKNNRKVLNEV